MYNRPIFVYRLLFLALIVFSSSFTLHAQAPFNFQGVYLESGLDLKPGAVYRFPGVKTGIDARLTIRNITGGLQLTAVDEASSAVYNEAIQPVIIVPPSSTGYAEFQLELISTVGSQPVTQTEFPVTAIDIDGITVNSGQVLNFTEFQVSNSFYEYDYVTPHLSLVSSSPQGEWLMVKNKSAYQVPTPDTAMRSIMATMVYKQSGSMVFRIGAQNTSMATASITRSLYFKRFTYPRINILPNRTLLSFGGTTKAGNAVELNGTLSASHTYNKILIEKNTDGGQFAPIGEIAITEGSSSLYSFTFTDINAISPVSYYRARLLNTNDRVMETGTILAIRKTGNVEPALKLMNTIIPVSSGETIISSPRKETAQLSLYNEGGLLIRQQQVVLYSGSNYIRLPLDGSLNGSFAFLRIGTADAVVVRKVWLQ